MFERSEFENFRKENPIGKRKSGLSGVCFFCLLCFAQAKKSRSPSAKPDTN
ncbi:hypothetical protein HMPREF9996_00632 [Aggregatibacter actinomycetemcomitans Y4]|nr:hypothetical protein HMPREF9996_00632 [Aggregatibacter actinomycetemcomitans Y4]